MPSFFDFLKALLRPARAGSPIDTDVIASITGEPVGDPALYELAMKHRSLLRGQSDSDGESNERLEFLGDAILGWVVAEHLYRTYPTENEGFLTRLRSKIVSGKALAERAVEMGLDHVVLLSDNAEQDVGRKNASILADACEALIGAVYLDRGPDAARRFINRSVLQAVDLEALANRQDNHKSLLLEYSQARGWHQPSYRVVEEEGPGHNRRFTVEAVVRSRPMGTGRARSKKRAEQLAAAAALAALRERDEDTIPVDESGAASVR